MCVCVCVCDIQAESDQNPRGVCVFGGGGGLRGWRHYLFL